MAKEGSSADAERVGPYTIYGELGSGGMASVHLGQLRSASGFTRIVAIKRMHAELARSPEFVAMFFQEARLVGRIQHPNVVAALDCVAVDKDAMLVMEYVHGVSLHQLVRKPAPVPLPIASAILVGAALGLHAAHEAVDDHGKNLRIVHRDISPQNILVGVDGLARVLDFGIAKAAECVQHTRTGHVRGKIGYMAPEQLLGVGLDRAADVYSLGVVMWEIMTGRRLFPGKGPALIMTRVANGPTTSPRSVNPNVSPQVAAVIMKALARSPEARYRSALELAEAVEAIAPPASQRVLGDWVAKVGEEDLTRRAAIRVLADRLRAGTLEPSDDRLVTSPLRNSRDAGAPSGISLIRTGGARSRSRRGRVAWIATVIVAALAVVVAVRSATAARRAVRVDASAVMPPAPQPPPARDDWTAPAAWTVASAMPPPNANARAPQKALPPPDASARRAQTHAPVRSRAPRTRGSPTPSLPGTANALATPESDLSAIGGRE